MHAGIHPGASWIGSSEPFRATGRRSQAFPPGFFKARTNDDHDKIKVFLDSGEEIDYHKKRMVFASFDFVERLGAKVIVVFSFVGPRDSVDGDCRRQSQITSER